MPTSRNNAVGSDLVASATQVTSGEIVIANRSFRPLLGFQGIISPGWEQRMTLVTTNLPNLCWTLYLHPEYDDPFTGLTYPAQLGITWQPTINSFQAFGFGPAVGIQHVPFTPPIALPIGVPVTHKCRCAVEMMSMTLTTPPAPPPGFPGPPPAPVVLNRISFNLSASQ